MERPLGAQISHMLKDRGVDVIFGIPGVHNQEMYRGIEEAGITHVLARHEQGAGFMSDGYARATGRPGVCYLISGPGFCNAMTALGQAYSDSIPVLAIASCLDETASNRGQLHQMRDQQGAGRAVCDWSETARTPDATFDLIDRAFGEFLTARPRPKAIHVPIALAEGAAPPAPGAPPVSDGPPWRRPAPQKSLVQKAANALLQAQRPLLILGGGARQARDAAAAVLSRSGAASMVTYAGRGVVDRNAPLHFGSILARPSSADVIGSADVVLVAGAELSETDLWRDETGIKGALIRIDLDPEVLTHRRTDIAICADAAEALAAIADALPKGPFPASERQGSWTPDEVARLRRHWRAEVDTERPGIVPVCQALSAALPDDTMIYSDMTQFAYAAKEVWDMPKPGHWHHPTGFGTLGYALPAAIGGAMGRPGQPTMAIAGDYGFQYTLQDLATAVELGLPLPILIWDNGKLGEIEDSMVRAQIAPNAVIQRNPDFLKLADAYGAFACQPATLEEVVQRTLDAFTADRPTIIRMTPNLTA